MKAVALLARFVLLLPAGASNLRTYGGAPKHAHLLPNSSTLRSVTKMFTKTKQGPNYGNTKCPCIGIDNVPGKMTMAGGEKYPADTGARCESWDDERAKECHGEKVPDWCGEDWCYVDPCNCELDEAPKHSTLQPEAEYQGRLMYYSYATCGSKDTWTEGHNKEACAPHKTKEECSKSPGFCSWKDGECLSFERDGFCKDYKPEEKKYGKHGCPCIGINNIEGEMDLKIGNHTVHYPADTGAQCKAWDENVHPDCKEGDEKPWCKSTWCYVDPCNCELPEGQPEQAFLLQGALFQGKPIYYSYETCGSTDDWAGATQCKTKKSEDECDGLGDCTWNGKVCLGWELDGICEMFDEEVEEGGSLDEIEKTPEATAEHKKDQEEKVKQKDEKKKNEEEEKDNDKKKDQKDHKEKKDDSKKDEAENKAESKTSGQDKKPKAAEIRSHADNSTIIHDEHHEHDNATVSHDDHHAHEEHHVHETESADSHKDEKSEDQKDAKEGSLRQPAQKSASMLWQPSLAAALPACLASFVVNI